MPAPLRLPDAFGVGDPVLRPPRLQDVDRVAVVGYWTAPDARRQGVAFRAMQRLCRWLFDDVGLARLELSAAVDNPASNALAARLGFRLEGTRRSAMLLSATADLPAVRVDAHDWGRLSSDAGPPA